MAKIRMPLTNLKRKLPSIFLGVCITLVVIFLLNVIQGAYKKGSLAEVEAGLVDGRRLANYGAAFGKRRRGRKRNGLNDEDDGVVCKMPKLNIKTDANKFAFYKMAALNCSGESLLYMYNRRLFVNETVLNGRKIKKCTYNIIEWQSDDYSGYKTPIIRTEEPFLIKIEHDFFRVDCDLHKKVKTKRSIEIDGNPDGQNEIVKTSDGNPDGQNGRVKDEDNIHQPSQLGSVGMPDPVFIQQADPFAPKSPVNISKNTVMKETALIKENHAVTTTEMNDFVENNEDARKQAMYRMEQEAYDAHNEYFFKMNYGNRGSSVGDYEQFFAQVSPKKEVIERLKDTKAMKNSLQLNVLIIALDSMSHLSYQRKLPKTYDYLKKTLGAVILNGYNIVGDATTAAILPITTGKSETELPEVRRGKVDSTYVDSFPLIWNKYEQSGYVTLYAEDQPGFGTFQLRFNGFEEQPVDHYMRPFWQAAIESHTHQASENFCLGNQPEHRYQLNYVKQFFHEYREFPKFAFNFHGELSHADNNPAEYIDNDIVELLTHLSNTKALDNTVVVVMGDHGARYSKVRRTVQGKLEERLPLMSFTFPEWFKEKYSKYYKNLKTNADRLTTPFDIHETLKDLLDITRAEVPVKYNDRGISLLHEIPANRTCASAHIDIHWCTCMKYEEVDIGHQYVVHGAKLMVEQINSLLSNHQDKCERLRLAEISDAKMIIPNEKMLKFLKNIDPDQRVANFSRNIEFDIVNYQIIVLTSPNQGLYEGTVQYNIREDKWQISPDLSRINAYGSQPSCILKTLPELRKFCYCRDQAKKTS